MSFRTFLRTAAAALALAALTVPAAFAQQFGYVAHEAVIVNMDEYQDIQEQLGTELQQSQRDLQTRAQALQADAEQLERRRSLMTQEQIATQEQSLMQEQATLQQEAAQIEQRLAMREQELLSPLLERLQAAIDAEAAERGLVAVFNAGALVYSDEGQMVNITPAVARRMGIDLPAEAEPSVDMEGGN